MMTQAKHPEAEPDTAAPEPVEQLDLPEESNSVVARTKAQLSLAARRIVAKTATLEEQSAKIERLCRSIGDQYYVAFKRFFQEEYDRCAETPDGDDVKLSAKERAAATPVDRSKKKTESKSKKKEKAKSKPKAETKEEPETE